MARLEAAVGRLETVITGTPSAATFSAASSLGLAAPILAASTPPNPSVLRDNPAVVAFDELMCSALARLVSAGDKLGGKVQQASQFVVRAFKEEQKLIKCFSQCKVIAPVKSVEFSK